MIDYNDFFIKYLAIFGIEGNQKDFKILQKWYLDMIGAGEPQIYPNCLQKRFPMKEVALYGKYTTKALNLVSKIVDYNNYIKAIESYTLFQNKKVIV